MKNEICMTRSKTLRALLLASLFFTGRGAYADDAKKEQPQGPPPPSVRVEAWLVAMPEEKFIALLPYLRDNAKIDGAVAQILEAVKRKEMILRGCPMLITQSGQRGISGVTYEAGDTMDPTPDVHIVGNVQRPVPLGITLEVEPVVSSDLQIIDMNTYVQDSEIPKGDENTSAMLRAISKDRDPKNNPDRPAYIAMKSTMSLLLRDGRYVLLDTHKMIQAPGYVEVFVIRAVVLPVETK